MYPVKKNFVLYRLVLSAISTLIFTFFPLNNLSGLAQTASSSSSSSSGGSSSSSSSSGSSTSSSSSSSSGNTVTIPQINNNLFCSGSIVLCNNGLTPVCSQSDYEPTCLPAFGDNIINCCRNNGISLYCQAEMPVCKSVTPSSSSSGGVRVSTFCKDGFAYCSSGSFATCVDLSYTPRCLAEGSVECCKENDNSLYCRPEIALSCPVSSPQAGKFEIVNLDVVSNPKLPAIVELPLITDEFANITGIAHIGSSTAFEVRLPASKPKLTVTSVDLKDSSGFIFYDVPFLSSEIPGQPDKLIIKVTLPDSIKEGETRFDLNFNDGSFDTGVIEIIKPTSIAAFKANSNKVQTLGKPRITKVSVSRNKNKFFIAVKGRNFVGRRLLIKEGDVFNLVENPKGVMHTSVTIFPSSLNPDISKTVVSKNGKILRVKFSIPSDVEKKTKANLVLSTPAGEASQVFTINSNISIIGKPDIPVFGQVFCSGGKVHCTNGQKPFCTNSSFEPKCINGQPSKIPDCCRDDDNSFECRAYLLKCK